MSRQWCPAFLKTSRTSVMPGKQLSSTTRLNVNIATLQETPLANAGRLNYTFFWQGKSSDEPREHRVGFAVKNSLLSMVEPGSSGSKWLLNLCLNTTKGPVTLVSVYVPMLSTTLDAKDEFYENLASTIRNIPSTKQLVLLGNFNARVGTDNDSWPSCLGPFGVGKMNENGQWLLKLCVFHNLCITNSFFKTKPQHKVSWRHLHSKHWHQLDLILVIKNILHTCSYNSMDCDTGHSLVRCKIRLQPKKFHCAKKPGNPHIDVSKMTQSDLMEQFTEAFEEEYDASQSGDTATVKWETLQDTIHHIALAIFGKKTSVTWLVWGQVVWDDPHYWGKACHTRQVQGVTHWVEPTDSQGCQEQGPMYCQTLHQMSTGQSTVRWSRWPLQRTTSDGCMMASRRHWDQCRARWPPSNLPLGKSSQTKAGRWRDGWNTILTSTPEKTLWLPQPWVQSSACQSWKSLMWSQLWMSSARSLTVWPQARHQTVTVFLQTSSSTVRPPYCTPCMKSSASAGERELCHKTWEMPRALPCTRTRVREATATTTEASLFSTSLEKSTPGSSWSACRSWLSASTQNHSVASELKGLQ